MSVVAAVGDSSRMIADLAGELEFDRHKCLAAHRLAWSPSAGKLVLIYCHHAS